MATKQYSMDFFLSELGCSSSRSWAEINNKFGEPLGSYRGSLGVMKQVLTCNLKQYCNQHNHRDCEEGDECWEDDKADPGHLLGLSMIKQREMGREGCDLYRQVLLDNTVRTLQEEINRAIMASFSL